MRKVCRSVQSTSFFVLDLLKGKIVKYIFIVYLHASAFDIVVPFFIFTSLSFSIFIWLCMNFFLL